MKIRISGIIQSVTNQPETTEAPGGSTEKQALSLVDDFLDASCVVSDEGETVAAKLYSDYKVFCESQGTDWVNQTAFAVRVMAFYQGRGVERDEVIRDGKRIETYKGLALKSKAPSQQLERTPRHPKAASTDRREVSERKRKEGRIRCYRCDAFTPHSEQKCDYSQYAASWLLYVCGVCGSRAYARKGEL